MNRLFSFICLICAPFMTKTTLPWRKERGEDVVYLHTQALATKSAATYAFFIRPKHGIEREDNVRPPDAPRPSV